MQGGHRFHAFDVTSHITPFGQLEIEISECPCWSFSTHWGNGAFLLSWWGDLGLLLNSTANLPGQVQCCYYRTCLLFWRSPLIAQGEHCSSQVYQEVYIWRKWRVRVLVAEISRCFTFFRWCLEMALSRPVTALDNERFTVQSVMLKYAVPIVLVGLISSLCCWI